MSQIPDSRWGRRRLEIWTLGCRQVASSTELLTNCFNVLSSPRWTLPLPPPPPPTPPAGGRALGAGGAEGGRSRAGASAAEPPGAAPAAEAARRMRGPREKVPQIRPARNRASAAQEKLGRGPSPPPPEALHMIWEGEWRNMRTAGNLDGRVGELGESRGSKAGGMEKEEFK